jgi:metallo-beta-lactamase family protein
MKISVHGAAREVTGSCYCVETADTRVLVDCGMFQGSAFTDAKNFRPFGFVPEDVDALIVTHAHLDHTGRIPKLVQDGFRGPIHMTPPTVDITRIVLEDASDIMQEQFEREYRPKLYEREDLEQALALMEGMDYSRWKTVGDIRFRFRDAGHIFGSAFVELEDADGTRVVFSGDIGNVDTPILRPTAQMGSADAVFIESTYGNRIHEGLGERAKAFEDIVLKTVKRKGALVIPAFAIERTQALLYDLDTFFDHRGMEPVDVYLDSPMAIRVTDIMKAYPEYYDREALNRVTQGDDFFDFPSLHVTFTRRDSKMINDAPFPKIIIAGSGMMHGGRIQHHLVRYLSKKNTTVFIVGFQASGTLGRKIYSGEKRVKIFGETVDVKADVISIGSFSAHGDQHKLINWLKSAKSLPKRVYCTHGEEEACAALATRITEKLRVPADVPRFEDMVTV